MRIVLLDGNENQAVAAVRSLARAGHVVDAGAETRWSKAGLSRSARASFRYASPRRDVGAFIDGLIDLVAAEPGSLVLPLTESSTLAVSAHRERLLHAGARLVLPPHESVLRAFDKEATRQIAESVGVRTPVTRPAATIAEAEAAAADIGYPVVLKARSSEAVGPAGQTRSTGAPRYARSPAGLALAFERLRRRAPEILLQEWFAGTGTGYFALLDRGELRAEFAHVRIRDVRPTGSGSAVRESIPVEPAVRAASLAILRSLDWHGVAMVEYRRRTDGAPVFLEVNGRFWNSLALAVHAGADFPRYLAALARDGRVQPSFDYRVGVRCRWLLGDARHLLAALKGPPPDFPGEYPGRLRALGEFLRPTRGMTHDNFSLADPLPELGDWADFILRRIPAALHSRKEAGE